MSDASSSYLFMDMFKETATSCYNMKRWEVAKRKLPRGQTTFWRWAQSTNLALSRGEIQTPGPSPVLTVKYFFPHFVRNFVPSSFLAWSGNFVPVSHCFCPISQASCRFMFTCFIHSSPYEIRVLTLIIIIIIITAQVQTGHNLH